MTYSGCSARGRLLTKRPPHIGGVLGVPPRDDKGGHAIDWRLAIVVSIRVHEECGKLLQLVLAVRSDKLRTNDRRPNHAEVIQVPHHRLDHDVEGAMLYVVIFGWQVFAR